MMWSEQDNALVAQLEFDSFEKAMDFMQQAARVITQHNHHPEWSNVYNKISIKLTTHNAGNKITDKDRKLAEELEKIYCQIV